MGSIRWADRVFITGTTGSGKSTLSRTLFLASGAPRLIIDPNDSDLTEIPGAVTFRDVRRATNANGENWRQAATARYVPRDPMDADEYDLLYRWVFYNGPRRIWVDEAGFVHPARGSSKHGRLLYTQGRKRGLGVQACHTRPIEVDRNLVAQSRHSFIFDTPVRTDRRYLAENLGIEAEVFEAAHAQLVKWGFLYHDREAKQLIVCSPLDA